MRKDLGVLFDTGLPDKEIVVSLDILLNWKELTAKKGDKHVRLEVNRKPYLGVWLVWKTTTGTSCLQ